MAITGRGGFPLRSSWFGVGRGRGRGRGRGLLRDELQSANAADTRATVLTDYFFTPDPPPPSGITYEGLSSARNSSAATTLNIPYPATDADDVLVLFVTVASGTSPTNPAGFTSLGTLDSGGSAPEILAAYRVCDGAETGNLTVTTPSATSHGQLLLFRGVDPTTPIDVTPTTFSTASSVTAYDLPTLTTTVDGVALVYAGLSTSNSGSFTPPTVPAGFTETYDDISNGPGTTSGYLLDEPAGATGTVNLVRSSNLRGAAFLIPLRPLSEGTTGTLATTLDGATLAASGAETFTGTLATTLAGATLVASGTQTVNVTGTLATTLAGSTLVASGAETFTGTLSTTLAGATLAGSGVESMTGTLATTLAGVTLAGSGTETIPGTLATTLAGVTLAASGTQTITGTLATSLAGATLAATGTETFTGTLATTLGSASLVASGIATPPPVTGALATTLDGASLAASGTAGTPPVTGTLATTLGGATLAASGTETFTGVLATALDGSTLAASGVQTISGTLGTTLAGVTLVASGSGGVAASPITITTSRPATRYRTYAVTVRYQTGGSDTRYRSRAPAQRYDATTPDDRLQGR